MKAIGIFAAVSAAIILAVGGVCLLVWPGGDAQRAIVTSAGLAFAVQLFGFALMRLAARSNPIAGWGLVSLMRFAVLGVYALVIVKALGLASAPALVSLAAFFFLSTLVEPLLLNV